MFDKLDFISDKYDELSRIVSDPSVISNQTVWQKHVRELSGLEPIVKKYMEYKKVKDAVSEAKEILNESGIEDEMRELAKMELAEQEEKLGPLKEELRILLLAGHCGAGGSSGQTGCAVLLRAAIVQSKP